MALSTSTTLGSPARRRSRTLDARARVILPPAVRARLEDYIARALAILDAADAPVADMEPDHDGEEDVAEVSAAPVTLALDRVPAIQRPRRLRVIRGATCSAPIDGTPTITIPTRVYPDAAALVAVGMGGGT